ncbi:hypothetical protein VUR80DRAFT_5445 [Thermomyces stellatus]
MPEWNLRDITDPSSDLLLSMLRRRATTSLVDQYCDSPDGTQGDASFIFDMMQKRNLSNVNSYKDSYTVFYDEDKYGSSFTIAEGARDEVMRGMAPALRSGQMVPQAAGELIMIRQMYLLQCLNIIIEDILELGSLTRDKKENAKKPDQTAAAAFSKLSIDTPPAKITLPDLLATSRDKKDALEEFIGLLTSEPVVLTHAVNGQFFSRPELLPDEKGRRLPAHTDKYISATFFEVIHEAIRAAAHWNYIARLLELLQSPADKLHRTIILQELANMCHLEYARAQATFKRHVQIGTGSKHFRRVSNALDKAGNARVAMEGKPEDHTRSDPQLHYILRLCQAETNAVKAMDWVKKLSDLHEAHPSERERLFEGEVDAFCDLVVMATFIQDVTSAISLPSLSRKGGQAFASRSRDLEAELGELKKKVDLRDFVVPIDNLLEPGVAEGALRALDLFVAENANAKLGLLYYDMVDECVADGEERYRQAKGKLEKQKENAAAVPQLPSGPEASTKIQAPTEKRKTRPPEAASYEIVPPAERTAFSPTASQTFDVSPSAVSVFAALFDRSQSRGSVAWTAFEAAMAELGFSVVPRFGSVYRFMPPGAMAVKGPFTVHRPHGARIEGYRLLVFARRLGRAYGWGPETFRVK